MNSHRTRAIASTAIGLAVLLGGAGSASADGAYRYWSFWSGTDGAWEYSQLGPASVEVHDGDVHGWRFGISTGESASSPAPRTQAADLFTLVCGSTPPESGMVRVAFVIDPGDGTSAPDGQAPPDARVECAVVPEGSTGAIALSDISQLRVESGFVCGIDGYPVGECAPSVASPAMVTESSDIDVIRTPKAPSSEVPVESAETGMSSTAAQSPDDASPDDSGTPWSTILVVGILALAGMVTALVIRARRT